MVVKAIFEFIKIIFIYLLLITFICKYEQFKNINAFKIFTVFPLINQLSVAAGFEGPELQVTFTLSPTSYIE